MAMINCPECGKEISDKAKKCIHCGKVLIEEEPKMKKCDECGKEVPVDATECPYCGCPIEGKKAESIVSTSKPKRNLIKIIIPIAVIIIVAIIGFAIYNVKVIQPKKIEAENKATYEEAVALLEKGEYQEADVLLDTIIEYNDVSVLKEELFYESRVYQCIKSIKEYLKNPDSLQVYEVIFYSKEFASEDTDTKVKDIMNSLIETFGSEPICIIRYGAQNGFGGNTTGYAMFTYLDDTGAYQYLGSCDTLDEDEVDEEDEDICTIINFIKDNLKEEGTVSIDRIKTVLKNDNYSTIKIIE